MVWVGVVIPIAGAAQLFLVAALSPDPNPNPVGSGMLMWASWFVGAAFIAVGLLLRGWKFPWV